MLVVLLSGKARAGKDKFHEIVKEQYKKKNDIMKLAFADEVKKVAKYMGWDGVKDDKGRQLLINIGQGGRDYYKDIWVNKLLKIMWNVSIEYVPDIVFITDCRYLNEIEKFKKQYNCVSVRIERPDFNNGLTDKQKQSESECALDYYEFDYKVINDGTSNYKQQVLTVFRNIIKDYNEGKFNYD